MKKGYKALLAEAEAVVETMPAEQALSLHGDDGVVFVDLRPARDPTRGAHPRFLPLPAGNAGILIDLESPYASRSSPRTGASCSIARAVGSALAARTAQEMGWRRSRMSAAGSRPRRNAGGAGGDARATEVTESARVPWRGAPPVSNLTPAQQQVVGFQRPRAFGGGGPERAKPSPGAVSPARSASDPGTRTAPGTNHMHFAAHRARVHIVRDEQNSASSSTLSCRFFHQRPGR